MSSLVLAIMLALGSAATFGLSTSLQHLASSRLAGRTTRSLLASLLRTPTWLLGMALSVAAFGMHALALLAGALMVVQPVIVAGVVFAVWSRSMLARRLPARGEVGWAAVTWAGLAVFLLSVGPADAVAGLPQHAVSAVAGMLGLAGVAALIARRCPERGAGKGLWLGVVSGVLFGLVAVLLKLAPVALPDGIAAVLLSWPLWLMVACGVCAVLINQRAYQTTRLSVSMPILNIVDVLVALGLAAVIFGEVPLWTLGSLIGGAAGLVAMILGVTKLAGLEDEVKDRPDDLTGLTRTDAVSPVAADVAPIPELMEVS